MGGTMTAEALPKTSQLRRETSKWPLPPEDGYSVDDYVSTGVHHDRLKLSAPYDINIDLTAIDQL
ncbi:hypothetical protein ACFCZY_15810 [Streptomyces sp. NPDC056237]|uniref:hypothetical protein n=1 Tax=unclassified Streptomyces TaxID=2593676 RepID=UPI0035E0D858